MAPPEPTQDAIDRLSATLEAILQRLSKPELDATALRAQIMCTLRKWMALLVIIPS